MIGGGQLRRLVLVRLARVDAIGLRPGSGEEHSQSKFHISSVNPL